MDLLHGAAAPMWATWQISTLISILVGNASRGVRLTSLLVFLVLLGGPDLGRPWCCRMAGGAAVAAECGAGPWRSVGSVAGSAGAALAPVRRRRGGGAGGGAAAVLRRRKVAICRQTASRAELSRGRRLRTILTARRLPSPCGRRSRSSPLDGAVPAVGAPPFVRSSRRVLAALVLPAPVRPDGQLAGAPGVAGLRRRRGGPAHPGHASWSAWRGGGVRGRWAGTARRGPGCCRVRRTVDHASPWFPEPGPGGAGVGGPGADRRECTRTGGLVPGLPDTRCRFHHAVADLDLPAPVPTYWLRLRRDSDSLPEARAAHARGGAASLRRDPGPRTATWRGSRRGQACLADEADVVAVLDWPRMRRSRRPVRGGGPSSAAGVPGRLHAAWRLSTRSALDRGWRSTDQPGRPHPGRCAGTCRGPAPPAMTDLSALSSPELFEFQPGRLDRHPGRRPPQHPGLHIDDLVERSAGHPDRRQRVVPPVRFGAGPSPDRLVRFEGTPASSPGGAWMRLRRPTLSPPTLDDGHQTAADALAVKRRSPRATRGTRNPPPARPGRGGPVVRPG